MLKSHSLWSLLIGAIWDFIWKHAAQSCSGITDSHNGAIWVLKRNNSTCRFSMGFLLHYRRSLAPHLLHIMPALSLRLTHTHPPLPPINPTGAQEKTKSDSSSRLLLPNQAGVISQQPASPSMADQGVCRGVSGGWGAVEGCYENILLFPCTFPVMMCGQASGWLPLACTNSCDAV